MPPMSSTKVLLIGWDAADWKIIRPLMDAGRMPNVRHMVESGAAGDIATLHPPLSPMLWTSICTGKRPFQHGIHGFTEPAPGGSGVRPVTNLSRKSKAIWNILNQNGLRSVVIGWWPSHPAEPIDGVMVSDHYHRAHGPLEQGWPLGPYAVHPPQLAATLSALRVHPDSLTPATVERFIPLAREIDQDRDTRLAGFLRTLAEAMSIQAAAAWLLENQDWDFFAVYYESLDHFSHGFMRYHPPRQSWIAARDFALYHNVVSAAYEFHDEMLGALLARAGAGTNVILMSDHGFHPDHMRPASIPDVPAGPAIEHRDFGILAMRGPAIKTSAPLYGASLLDITPTILTMYGLPVGEDMDGKVLAQAFANPPAIETVPSWEEIPGEDGRHPPHTRFDPVATQESLEQMIALGYVDRPDENRELAMRNTVRELRYNLAQSYQDAGRHHEAHQILRPLWEAEPGEQRLAVRLFLSCQALRRHEEMTGIVEELAARGGDASLVDYLKAQLLVAGEHYGPALALLERIAAAPQVRPGVFLETGGLYLRLRRPGAAQRVYEQALEIDPDNVQAHMGLCRVALLRRDYTAATQAALDALERCSSEAGAHYLLGRALAGMKRYQRAAEAFRTALSIQPNFPPAHLRLAALLAAELGDADAAREHRRLARSMRGGATAAAGERPSAAMNNGRDPACKNASGPMPPLADCLVVVTGLPRSGTSLLMQMLAAGGIEVVADGQRQPDEDNPRGYLESERVKNLEKDSAWLFDVRGRAVKIVLPLLGVLPPGLPCRVILCERDLDEVLDSQEKMLERRHAPLSTAPERRRVLKEEYDRTIRRAEAALAARPLTGLLVINHRQAVTDPEPLVEAIDRFLGGGLDTAKMASAVDPRLYRNRRRQPRS